MIYQSKPIFDVMDNIYTRFWTIVDNIKYTVRNMHAGLKYTECVRFPHNRMMNDVNKKFYG